ncbi:MAG: hypothetical protein KF752_09595 [Pirellulaceae bacterium]|nr:hypothetical protein [Pirellulaceae bacterium]
MKSSTILKVVRRTLAVGIAVIGLAWASSSASASDCYTPQVTWKTVTVYQVVQRPYFYTVTKYTSCGKAYQASQVAYQSFRVPVQKRVAVYH